MSPAILGLSAAVAALILIPVVAWLWMNRAPKLGRESSGVLPLFTGSGMTIANEEPDGADGDGVDHDRAARDEANRAARNAAKPTAPVRPAMVQPAIPQAPIPQAAIPQAAIPQAPIPQAPIPQPRRVEASEQAPPPRPPPTIRTFNTSRPSVAPDDSVARPPVDRQIIQSNLPTEGTLQFLPGRLEIASGQERGREIRFVRLPGPNGTEFTFGRGEGEQYKHIQLSDQTVSRQHARMRFHEGRWYLLSLSHTNPVIHVGRALAVGEEHVLDDGDRIEMGEVLCTFKNR